MWPDCVSNPRPVALEADTLPTALRGPALPQNLIDTIELKAATEKSWTHIFICKAKD